MQKKVLYGLLLAITVSGFFFLSACTSDIIEVPAPVTDTISFSQDIQPVFNSTCISCHRAGGTSPDLTEGNSYQSLMTANLVNTSAPENSELYKRLIPSGPSHPVKNQDFANVILAWIQQGALDN